MIYSPGLVQVFTSSSAFSLPTWMPSTSKPAVICLDFADSCRFDPQVVGM